MPGKKLLVILASIFAASSARIEEEKTQEEWARQEPFQIIMSWYLKHAYAVTVQVIHRRERDTMYHHSAKLITAIHETTSIAVLVTHCVIETEEHPGSWTVQDVDGRPFNGNESVPCSSITHRGSSKAGANQLPCNWKCPNQSRPISTHSHTLRILLIPDEVTFQAFLHRGGFWSKNQVKFMLVIVVPESSNILCQGNPEGEDWKTSARNILERVWSEDKVLNIFLSAPTSACIKDYLFAWNPFATSGKKFSGTLKRLKVNPADPNVHGALSNFAISLKNMNGYPLKVCIFERVPTLMASSYDDQQYYDQQRLDINEITGLDGLILRTLVSRMNCSVELSPPSDDRLYGWKMRNGTFSGMLGDIVYRRVDFAANGVFLKDYQTATATEFTNPISCESICVAVPREGMIPQWLQIFQCFSPLVWNLLFFNVMIYGLLRHVLRTLLRERRPRRNLLETILETALIFLSSPQSMPRLNSERILVGFYLLFNMIVIGTFQGTLYEGFTNPEHYKNIDTLADLDNSGLPIATGSPNLLNIFGIEEDSPTLAHLRRKTQFSQSTWETGAIDRAAWKQDTAAIERKNDLQLSILTKFLDGHGEPVLHIVAECPRSYHLAFMVPSGAFFLRRMNVLLRRMVESGLIPYWYNATVELLIMKSHYAMAKKLAEKDKARPFDLENLQISFIVLGSGLLLSILVFIGEILIFRRRIPRRNAIPKITVTTRNFSPPS